MSDSSKAVQKSPRRNQAVTLQQAATQAPILQQLIAKARQSEKMLGQIQPVVPPSLHAAIQAGSLNEKEWCLIVPNSSAAAKLRQLAPAISAHLRSKGYAVEHIRIRVAASHD